MAPLVVWCVHNYIVSSTLMGERAPSLFNLQSNTMLTAQTIAGWFLHPRMVTTPAVVALGALALGTLFVTGVRSGRLRSIACVSGAAVHPLLPFFTFTALYLAVLLFSATTVAFDTLDYRLLSPVYVPLLCALVCAIDAVAARERPSRVGRAVPALLKLAMIAWLAYPVTAVARVAHTRIARGIGYSSARWARSPLIRSLKQQPLRGYVASNNAYLVYALTGSPAHRSPEKFMYNSQVQQEGALARFEANVAAAPDAYLVWFKPTPFRHLHHLEEIKTVAHLTAVRQFPEGTVYRLRTPMLTASTPTRGRPAVP
jgi:hypothetical protein